MKGDINAWKYETIGVNRGDSQKHTAVGTLEDILEHVYVKAENHDTIHLDKLANSHSGHKVEKSSEKVVCVKITGVPVEDTKKALENLGITNLNVVIDGVRVEI